MLSRPTARSPLRPGPDETVVPLVVRRRGEDAEARREEGGARMSSVASLASVELSGVLATSPDALRRRLLGPWALGLRQYLALRLGDPQRAGDAFRELRRLVSAMPASELVREPGPKAHVYRLARRIALDLEAQRPVSARGREALAFRDPPDATRGYADALQRVRRSLSGDDAELVELRFARELSPAEIACVVEQPLVDVELRLARATARAFDLLGAHAPDPHATRGGPLVDAFALAKGAQGSATRTAEGESLAALPPGTLIGARYRVVKRVGIGAFGDVYMADDADVPGHRVALKMLREPSLSTAAREAALRELKLIAAVFHPSVVQFKDHGWHEDRLWFVMPWYEGETLDQRMQRGPLARAEARRIFEPLARALAALHANGIRHQDIKPDNVFLARIKGFGPDGEHEESIPVLLDLGVAAKEHEALIGGTPVYFAPEVASHYANVDDERPIGPKADVFALALTLRNALEPDTEEDVPAGAIEAFIERRARERPPLPRAKELRWLAPSFERWLAMDPDQRPSAEELARELAVLTRPEERRARRRAVLQWLVPLLVGLGAAFGALVYVFVRETELQELEISRARTEAQAARADLMVEAARLEALDADHAALLERYEQNRLTRQQLADQLATAEGQIRILGDQIGQLIGDRESLSASLDETREALATMQETFLTQRRQLDTELTRVRDLTRHIDELRIDSERVTAELEGELEQTRGRVEQLEDQLEISRAARREVTARAESLDNQLRESEAARERAMEELVTLRRRVAQLREILDPGEQPARRPQDTGTLDVRAPEGASADPVTP
ncbi:serine/threonine-protein kinase [Sandaracinus amylolyticus]|uniref:serine/threonine-protein kinase n=1 Tax=Sandaracinus amylolyticus TaxID=927083 RepID=UPI00069DCE60|nr:serine/threonine-protein kinase [Sandaracinus amylolyticus]